MEIINTILVVLQVTFGSSAALGILVGLNEYRKGSKNNSGTQQDAGLEGLIMGIVFLAALATVIGYIRTQLAGIQ